MEHLALASDGKLDEQDVVPYVATKDYRDRTLSDFLATEWPQKKLRLNREATVDQIASILQTWFFFGLFQEVLGSFFVDNDYIAEVTQPNGTTQRILTTAKLIPSLEAWTEYARHSLIEEEYMPVYRQLFKDLNPSFHSACYLLNMETMHRTVGISIQTSVHLLDCAIMRAFTWDGNNVLFSPKLAHLYPVDLSIMQKSGWCPTAAVRSWDKCALMGQMMLRSAPNPEPESSDHVRCTPDISYCAQIDVSTFTAQHASTGCKCSEWSIDEVFLDRIIEHDLIPLIQFTPPESGSASDTSFKELNLSLVSSTGNIPYVALSHVWAHGMGNPKKNSLPRCQLRGLISKLCAFLEHGEGASGLEESETVPTEVIPLTVRQDLQRPELARQTQHDNRKVHFWLDTLCCPARSHTKQSAISRMKDIYAEASDVLVLDRCLESLLARGRPPCELAMYICTSTWSQRVWTLQEGILARCLWFRFNDTFKRADWLLWQMSHLNKIGPINMAQMNNDFFTALSIINGGWHKDFSFTYRKVWTLLNITKALLYRSLSVPSDEAIILLNLLTSSEPSMTAKKRSTTSIQNVAPPRLQLVRYIRGFLHDLGHRVSSRRLLAHQAKMTVQPSDENDCANMTRFWDMCRRKQMLDHMIIFNELPKLKQEGYRWAPKSLLHDNHREIEAKASRGYRFEEKLDGQAPREECDPRGIVAPLPGFVVDVPSSLSFRRQIELQLSEEAPFSPWILLLDKSSGLWSHIIIRNDPPPVVIDPGILPNDRGMQIALIMGPEGTRTEATGLFATILSTSEVAPRVVHHVHGIGLCLTKRADPPLQQLLDRIIANPTPSQEDVTEGLLELGKAALLSLSVRQTVLDEGNGEHVKKYLSRVSQRLVRGQYLIGTERFVGGDEHRWIVD